MKRVLLTLLSLFIIGGSFPAPLNAASDRDLQTYAEDNFLRFHVRANSNASVDQSIKLKVRDAVINYIRDSGMLRTASCKEEAMDAVKSNINRISYIARRTLRRNGCLYDVRCRIDAEQFPYREYSGFFLPEGLYDALIIEIGSGKGDNWWCVIYPAVCMDSATNKTVDADLSVIPREYRLSQTGDTVTVTYDFWIVKFFKRIFGK